MTAQPPRAVRPAAMSSRAPATVVIGRMRRIIVTPVARWSAPADPAQVRRNQVYGLVLLEHTPQEVGFPTLDREDVAVHGRDLRRRNCVSVRPDALDQPRSIGRQRPQRRRPMPGGDLA